ncbi:alpha/beta fold hydrolase [Fibrella aquatilis]|uniref:Alpha/beta fold hydrolase n=1 Tax=Fibrella aquatilis TaxID=2817059 RepID=A0A939K0G9_9BACT|nr:alpha/beta fold hydrolase [Fibrella aquatilis]MBO0931991.1 alpha/beta fold hydrolase [Fibrella aquatilis]
MKQVIILGATGFIGSHVAEQFHQAGYAVTALVRAGSDTTAIRPFCTKICSVDFSDEAALTTQLTGFALLVNCLARVKVHATLAELNTVQVTLTERVTRAAIRAGVGRCLLLSTVEIYGFGGNPVKTETEPYWPTHAFQRSFASKEQAFTVLMTEAKQAGSLIDYAILQPASTIGRREGNSSFFAHLYKAHREGLYPLLDGGKARVSLVDTRDIGRAMVHLAEQPEPLGKTYLLKGFNTTWHELKQTIDLFTGRIARTIQPPAYLMAGLARLLEQVTPYRHEPTITPLAVDLFTKDVLINDQRLTDTGFRPRFSLEEAVADAITYLDPSVVNPPESLFDWKGQGRYTVYNGYRQFYRDTLTDHLSTVLLLHGFPTSSWDYHRLWLSLCQHHRLIAPDFLGFGFSDKPRQHTYSIQHQTDSIVSLLQQLEIKAVTVVAHNYGTIVAQELLARQRDGTLPIRLNRVSFLNGALFPELHRPTPVQQLLLSPLGAVLVRLTTKGLFARSLKAVFGHDTQPDDAEVANLWQLVRYNEGQLLAKKLLHYVADRRTHALRWTTAMTQTDVPLQFINGIDDPVSGLPVVEKYLAEVPHPNVVQLDHIGHYPQLEAAGRVVQALEAFI